MHKRIQTNKEYSDDVTGLKCPDCGGDYLHQVEVSATWRAEDKDGTRYSSSRTKRCVEKVTAGEIVGRRDAMSIYFTCEFCEPDSIKTLDIYQHKGMTFMGWFV